MNLSVDFRYRILVLLSLGLLGLFLVCLSTLEKATFRCWSTVFRWKYLLRKHTVHTLTDLGQSELTGYHMRTEEKYKISIDFYFAVMLNDVMCFLDDSTEQTILLHVNKEISHVL